MTDETPQELAPNDYILENGSLKLKFVHDSSLCVGRPCTVHNKTDHTMRAFQQWWRSDRRIMERICPHGVGHPDPDDFKIFQGVDNGDHACDGCCVGAYYRIDDDGKVTANG